jgi:hypothetical protein
MMPNLTDVLGMRRFPAFPDGERLFWLNPLVDQSHQGLGHGLGILGLDDISTIDNSARSLF